MLKKISLFLLIILAPFATLKAQDDMPSNVDEVITWNFSVEYISPNEALIVMKVTQKNGWHIYAQVQPPDAIPLPTEFNYNVNANFSLVGVTKEFGAKLYDNYGFPEKSFHGNLARFEQKIKIN